MSKPSYFPQRKVFEVQRSLGLHGLVYACLFCTDTFTQEPKLWLHAKKGHRDKLGAIGSSTEAEKQEREQFKQKAIQKAQSRENAPGPPAKGRVGIYNSKNTLRRSESPMRPSTAPETTEQPTKRIDSPSQLTTGEARTTSTGNPRKRGAGPGSASPEYLPRSQATPHSQFKVRHTEAPSSGQATDEDPEFRREKSSKVTPGFQKTLFDHKNDDLTVGNTSRSPKVPNTIPRGHHHHPSGAQSAQLTRTVPYESLRDDGSRLQEPPIFGAAGPIQILQPKLSKSTKSTKPVVLERAPVADPDKAEEADDPEPDTSMLRQPETRPISHDQLVVEVKAIYAGLVMVEAKCIDVDEKQTASAQEKDSAKKIPLTHDQWRSLIALHKQLLHEHHDFFLASQHPSASTKLSTLAAKYSMPARMWRHGIHAFLEVLRFRLPDSLEHMLAFIYIAYSMMALLFETVSTFEDTWIECLGDLGRYRMAIEDDEPKDREVWSGVAKYWYSKASDKSPTVGRLYHHLAILARPYTLEQLSLYTKSLTCVTPFESARGSIMTLLNPILAGKTSSYYRASPIETLGIKIHGILFTYPLRSLEEFRLVLKQLKESVIDDFLGDLEHNADKIKRVGAYFAVSNNAAMLEYGALTGKGASRSVLRQAFESARRKKAAEACLAQADPPSDAVRHNANDIMAEVGISGESVHSLGALTQAEAEISSTMLSHASELTFSVLSIAIHQRYWGSKYLIRLLPLVHVMMVFVWSNAIADNAIKHFETSIPWAAICLYLNNLAVQPGATTAKVSQEDFPMPENERGRPLWEDFILQGLLYTLWYFPTTWFSDADIDDEERQLEVASMDATRTERVLWLGHRIAALGRWIRFDFDAKSFELIEKADNRRDIPKPENIAHEDPFAEPAQDPDRVMDDAPSIASPCNSIAPSEAPELSTTSSPPTTLTDTTIGVSEFEDDPMTPKVVAAGEPNEDIPMIDISPGKEHKSEQETETPQMLFRQANPVADIENLPPPTLALGKHTDVEEGGVEAGNEESAD